MHTQGQGHTQRSKVKSFLLSHQKTTVASVIKLHAKGKNNVMICFIKSKVLLPKVRVTVRLQGSNHFPDLTRNC